MYIINFIRSLFHLRRLPALIYLALNTLFLGGMLYFLSSLTTPHPNITICLALSALTYAISAAIALSPIGEFMLRIRLGCKRIRRAEQQRYIDPIFTEVYARARSQAPSIHKNVRLFISSDSTPNALATGRRTICITKGLLSLPTNQIKAVIAHEFGHLAHKDTDLLRVIIVGNTLVNCTLFLVRALAAFLSLIADLTFIILGLITGRREVFAAKLASSALKAAATWIISAIAFLGSRFMAIIMKTANRENEYRADEFAFYLGYGNALCAFLDTLGEPSPHTLFETLTRSHPDPDSRIARLQKLGSAYSAKYDLAQPTYLEVPTNILALPKSHTPQTSPQSPQPNGIFTVPALNHTGQIIHIFRYYPHDTESGMSNPEYDPISDLIIGLKQNSTDALDYFYGILDNLLNKDICICVVPSSNPENILSGVSLLAMRLAASGRHDMTHILIRTKTIAKLAYGGCRDIDVHTNSITVAQPELIKDKHLLIIDDVTTTGNSLVACRQLLLEAGAAEVEMLALARTTRSNNSCKPHGYKLSAKS